MTNNHPIHCFCSDECILRLQRAIAASPTGKITSIIAMPSISQKPHPMSCRCGCRKGGWEKPERGFIDDRPVTLFPGWGTNTGKALVVEGHISGSGEISGKVMEGQAIADFTSAKRGRKSTWETGDEAMGSTSRKLWSSTNSLVGSIDANGKVWSSINTHLGTVDAGGRVWSPNNSLLGAVDPEGKVWSSTNSLVGSVDSDGKVWSPTNTLLATVGTGPGRLRASAAFLLLLSK